MNKVELINKTNHKYLMNMILFIVPSPCIHLTEGMLGKAIKFIIIIFFLYTIQQYFNNKKK